MLKHCLLCLARCKHYESSKCSYTAAPPSDGPCSMDKVKAECSFCGVYETNGSRGDDGWDITWQDLDHPNPNANPDHDPDVTLTLAFSFPNRNADATHNATAPCGPSFTSSWMRIGKPNTLFNTENA